MDQFYSQFVDSIQEFEAKHCYPPSTVYVSEKSLPDVLEGIREFCFSFNSDPDVVLRSFWKGDFRLNGVRLAPESSAPLRVRAAAPFAVAFFAVI